MSHMSKKRNAAAGGDGEPKSGGRSDRHKPSRMIRIRQVLAKQLDLIAERDAEDVTSLANRAVREFLERQGLWPPNKPTQQPSEDTEGGGEAPG